MKSRRVQGLQMLFDYVSFFRLVMVSQACLTLLFEPFGMPEIFNSKLFFKNF